jgi:hypothetical protein
METSQETRFIDTVKVTLPKDRIPRIEELDEAFEKAIAAAPLLGINVGEADLVRVKRRLQALYAVQIDFGSVLQDKTQEPWLEQARATIEPFYWNRYEKYLLENKGWPINVVQTLDDETERTLKLCGNPAKDNPWDRRGLVMGHVQSGKTANYIGLICKAADAGYKTIIVIAGIQNNLRNQTQIRVDEGFTGYDSLRVNSNILTGVGLIPPQGTRRPLSLTNSKQDFDRSKRTLGTPLDSLREPVVLVIKKNVKVLRNLYDWLKLNGLMPRRDKISSPLILIDDEADNASINIMYKKDEVSAINKAIRSVLSLFQHSTYVGYTATPFANIFIDPATDDDMLQDDLFPRSFIVSLDAPSNYLGADRMFLDEPERYIVNNEEALEYLPLKHTKEDRLEELPETLREAMRCFVLATAVRLLRGQGSDHSSMMINMTRFVAVQKNVKALVAIYLAAIAESCRLYASLSWEQAQGDQIISDLRASYAKFYGSCDEDWSDMQAVLGQVAPEITVAMVNSGSKDNLNYQDYPNGKKVIAIGGIALSRGLTLEGLTISYYLRNSVMYDTLIQMGRWFGYRPGYEDLCRIFMTSESEGHFTHVTESIAELREEMKFMEKQGATPEEFGLKVRSDPDTLIITAANKMGKSEGLIWKVGLANKFLESRRLKRDADTIEANRELAKKLARAVSEPREPVSIGEGYLFRDAPYDIVEDFFSTFRNATADIMTDPRLIVGYLRGGKDYELAKWDIYFPSIKESKTRQLLQIQLSDDITILCQQRSVDEKATTKGMLVHKKLRVASRPVEHIGLSAEEKAQAEKEFDENERKSKKTQYPDRIYRKMRKNPLLIVHLIDYQINDQPGCESGMPVVAWSLSLPDADREEKLVEYQVNAVYVNQQLSLFDMDIADDEMDRDEDGDYDD